MNRKTDKVYIWPVCSRIIHWMIAISFIASFITSFYENLLHLHVAFGYLFGLMIIYRIVWGFIGPRYATFKTFKLTFKEFKDYFIEKVQNRWRKLPPGHNAASSWFTILLLTFGLFLVVGGILLYGIQEGKGIAAFLNQEYYPYMTILLDSHIYIAYGLVTMVTVHIIGVFIEHFYHKNEMIFLMITGYKNCKGEDMQLPVFKHIFSYSSILIAFMIFYDVEHSNNNLLIKSKFTAVDYEKENVHYVKECGSCHKVYPPFMLPENSWKRIMRGLSNHFGDEITDANISKEQQRSIKDYLVAHSAEHSTREIAYKVIQATQKIQPKSVTKTTYWKETHKEIPRERYRSRTIKDKSNCFACHKDFEYGIVDDVNIVMDMNN
ncbi:MAG: cytochrome b/b6 domain-containing protein [Clostridiales bacterium]|nr:cytochrome b/b6 domain-containing protein [Clostridiales bacterium]